MLELTQQSGTSASGQSNEVVGDRYFHEKAGNPSQDLNWVNLSRRQALGLGTRNWNVRKVPDPLQHCIKVSFVQDLVWLFLKFSDDRELLDC